MTLLILIILSNFYLLSFEQQQQRQVTNKYVYVCGQYPNKYLSYARN